VIYLLDTDIVSATISRRPSATVLAHSASVPATDQVISSITVGELLYGALKRPEITERLIETLEALVFSRFDVVPFDHAAARTYAEIRVVLEHAGTRLDDPDLRIAATALAHDLTIVTGNTRHFDRVPGLRVENWFDP
jgi:tRNA(fMet)-specific endonuclease VapC